MAGSILSLCVFILGVGVHEGGMEGGAREGGRGMDCRVIVDIWLPGDRCCVLCLRHSLVVVMGVVTLLVLTVESLSACLQCGKEIKGKEE